jgi:hypothetical protein
MEVMEYDNKVLFSSPVYFTGEYTSNDISYKLSWPQPSQKKVSSFHSGNVYIRYFSILKFNSKNDKFSDNNFICDLFCNLITVIFGKYFENHGYLERENMNYIPDYSNIEPLKYYYLKCFNQDERVDYNLQNNFSNLSKIEKIIENSNKDTLHKINICCKFYNSSLKIFEKEPELSYLNLINSLEVLSSMLEFTEDELYNHDKMLCCSLKIIKDKIENADKIISFIKKRLYQIKRKIILTVLKYIDQDFLNKYEGSFDNDFYKITQNNLEKLMKKSYDLRSEYVHGGNYFGDLIFPINDNVIIEVATIPENSKYTQLLTFMGLERIVRYCILQYINEFIYKLK